GKDRGRRGDVRRVIRDTDRLIVTGVNMVKKHRRQRNVNEPSQIIEIESPIHHSNVRLVCRSCDAAVRVGFRRLEDGRKVRFCKSCDEVID
ncbi:MAG: 50S ribosomal protein L24, partial [Dehalococcoidia bacterium]